MVGYETLIQNIEFYRCEYEKKTSAIWVGVFFMD